MFTKVLIAEDFESSNISVQKVLEDLKIADPKYVSYCDDAFSRIKMNLQENNPFELLITDLSFDEDHREQRLKNGQQLISAAREIQPHLKVIVFSVEKKEVIIETFRRSKNQWLCQKRTGRCQRSEKSNKSSL